MSSYHKVRRAGAVKSAITSSPLDSFSGFGTHYFSFETKVVMSGRSFRTMVESSTEGIGEI